MNTDDRNYTAEARRIVTERSHSWLTREHGAALLGVIDAQAAAIGELQHALRVACGVEDEAPVVAVTLTLGPMRITTPETLGRDLRGSLAQGDGDDGTDVMQCDRCGELYTTTCGCDQETDR